MYSKQTQIFGKTVNIKYNDCVSRGEEQTFREKPLTLYIHINPICNARCAFCNVYKQCAPKLEFNLKKLSEVIIELTEAGKLGRIAITGGETFLHIELLDNILFTIKEVIESSIVTINTNASMLHKLRQLKNIDVLTEIRISRHHYMDQENDSIFGLKCASLSDIAEVIQRYGSDTIKLNCNLIKGHIDSVEEIEKYLDAVSSIGISNVGFVGLMPLNRYCVEHYVDYSTFKFPTNFLRVGNLIDRDICRCDNYVYYSPKCNLVGLYFREVRKMECAYCRQFSYSDNELTAGFGGKIIY